MKNGFALLVGESHVDAPLFQGNSAERRLLKPAPKSAHSQLSLDKYLSVHLPDHKWVAR